MSFPPNSDATVANLKKVLALNARLNSTLEIGGLLEVIMQTSAEVMHTETASLLLIDSENQDLVFQVALGEKGGALKEKFRVKMGEGIAGTVAQTGKSLRVNDVSQDTRFAKRFDNSTGFVTKAILCVPMHARGKIIGVLQAINPVESRPFTTEDQFLFETFADQAAIAVENARMHSEILKQERAKQDLKIAHDIQQNFLPDLSQMNLCINIAARTIPARDVGGDFYDVMTLNDHTAAVIIGDVSGKGVSAALYMVRAISEFRFLAQKFPKPAELLTALNTALAKNSPFGMFVTLSYLVLDLKKGMLSHSSAGHHAVVKRNSKDGTVEILENAGGPPSGLSEDSTFAQKETSFKPGDALFAYTDGVSEARNKKREEYGLERFKTCVAAKKENAEAYASALLDDLKKFTQGADQHDDITVLSIVIP